MPGGSLAQKLAAQLSATVLERLLQAVVLILIARQVGPAAFGPFAACIALTKILSVGFALGLDIWLLRNGYREGDTNRLAEYGTLCLTLRVGLGLLWLLGVGVLARWLDPVVFPPDLLLVTALAVWGEELANIVWSTFKAALQNQTLLKFVTLAQVIAVGVTLILIGLGVRSVLTFAWAQASIVGLHALVAVIWQIRTFGWRWRAATLLPILRASVPFALSAGLAMIYGRADIALVAYWLGQEAAGLYAPAVSLANALALIPTAVYYVMLPLLSRAYAQGGLVGEPLAGRFVWSSVAVGGLVGGGLALAAQPVVGLVYGPAFAATGRLVTVLSGVLAARFISMALATVLVAVGRQNVRVVAQTVVALLNVGLNLWVIRRWGLTGVAGVYVLTEWVLVIGYGLLAWSWRRGAVGKATVNPA
jgi:O-antigen/teichoic acid export membrane protein